MRDQPPQLDGLRRAFIEAQEKATRRASALMPIPSQYVQVNLTAADGWCAPNSPEWWTTPRPRYIQPAEEGETRQRDRLACGCTKNVLETGWHEFGCEIVGAHLCRQATKRTTAGTRSTAVRYSA